MTKDGRGRFLTSDGSARKGKQAGGNNEKEEARGDTRMASDSAHERLSQGRADEPSAIHSRRRAGSLARKRLRQSFRSRRLGLRHRASPAEWSVRWCIGASYQQR